MGEKDNLSIDLSQIQNEISKGDLFDAFDILNSQFDHTFFNDAGFYRLQIDGRAGLEDVEHLGKKPEDVNEIFLKIKNIGINYREELSGDNIIELVPEIDDDRISIRMHNDEDHWLYEDKLVFINLNPYI